jgi:hypothetical protein
MKKLSIFASIGAALLCAAVPASFNWSPDLPSSLDLQSPDRPGLRSPDLPR